MKTFITIVAIFFLMSGLHVSASAKDKPLLSQFSTNEIVAEYSRRLDRSLRAHVPSIKWISEYLEVDNLFSEETGIEIEPRIPRLYKTYSKSYESHMQHLTYFAAAGDHRAQEVIGPIALDNILSSTIETGSQIDNQGVCDGIQYAFSAAQKGSLDAIAAIPMLYLKVHAPLVLKTNPSSITAKKALARKYYYWVWEHNRASGYTNKPESSLFLSMDAHEREQLREDWINWSPSRASIDDVLQILCPAQVVR